MLEGVIEILSEERVNKRASERRMDGDSKPGMSEGVRVGVQKYIE